MVFDVWSGINLMGFVTLCVMYFNTSKRGVKQYTDLKLFRYLLLATMLYILTDTEGPLLIGTTVFAAREINYAILTLHFMLLPIPGYIWFLICDYKVWGSEADGPSPRPPRFNKRVWFYSVPVIVHTVYVLFTFSHDLPFYLDKNNIYNRGNLVWLTLLLAFGYVLLSYLILALKTKRKPTLSPKGVNIYYYMFQIFPAAAGLIQALFYGAFIFNLGLVVASFLIFTNVYNRRLTEITVENEKAEAKAREQAIAAENAALDKLNRMKSDIIETISHESRTPLAVLASYAGLTAMELKNIGVDEQIAADLDTIAFEAEHIAGLIDNMRKLSEQKKVTAKRIILDIGDLTRQTARLYERIVNRGGVELKINIPDDLPPVFGSPEELTQVIFNLLQNAKNHTDSGNITVTAENTDGSVSVSVSDTGSGVAPELLPRVFERGVTGGKGTGLGLAICMEVIESHGGEISIHNSQFTTHNETGTTVTFTIPIHDTNSQFTMHNEMGTENGCSHTVSNI